MRCSRVVFALLMGVIGGTMMAGGSAVGRSSSSIDLGFEPLPYFVNLDGEGVSYLPGYAGEIGSGDNAETLGFQCSFPLEATKDSTDVSMAVETQTPVVAENSSQVDPAQAIAEDSDSADDSADCPAEQTAMSKYDYYLRYMGHDDQQPTEAPQPPTEVPLAASTTELPQSPASQNEVSEPNLDETATEDKPATDDMVTSADPYDYSYDDFIMAEPAAEPAVVADHPTQTYPPHEAVQSPEAATAETAFDETYRRDREAGYAWGGKRGALNNEGWVPDNYQISQWNSRIGSIGDLSARLPSELLLASDYALLKTLARSKDESAELRRRLIEEHIATLGWSGLEFTAEFEASSGQDVVLLSEDLPMMAAFLACFRCNQRGEMTRSEAVDMLLDSAGDLPQSWTDAVQEIINESAGTVSPTSDAEAPSSTTSNSANRELFKAVATLAETSWQTVHQTIREGFETLDGWKTNVLAEANQRKTR